LGRVDYRVRAIHQDSGLELFNVSYSRLSLLDSILNLPTFGDTHALDAGIDPSFIRVPGGGGLLEEQLALHRDLKCGRMPDRGANSRML